MTNQLTSITHASPPALHAQLDDLLGETFGLSLADWHARGHWTADYTCYALIEHSAIQVTALAAAGVYRMEMLVRGEQQVWMQLGAVATRKERRGQGLSRRLLAEIFARHAGMPFFLFANDSVVDFYPRFGFRRIADRQPVVDYRLGSAPGAMRRLSVEDPLVSRYLSGRACFSQRLDCANAAPLNWFHLLLAYPDCVYEIPALGVMLVARHNGETLSLIDVCALRPVTFAELVPYLDFPEVSSIRFGFNPDWLRIDYAMLPTEESDATPIFARGARDGASPLPETGEWMVPLMVRT